MTVYHESETVNVTRWCGTTQELLPGLLWDLFHLTLRNKIKEWNTHESTALVGVLKEEMEAEPGSVEVEVEAWWEPMMLKIKKKPQQW